MADWRMLPYDILGDIALRLDYVKDYIYFSTVCHSWYHAHTMIKEKWTSKMRMPWLLLPESTKDNPNHCRILYCPITQRRYQHEFPEAFEARCWGSSCGWVVTLGLNLEFHLLNPFTRTRVALPPQRTMPDQPDDFKENNSHWKRQFYADRMLVFSYDDDKCIVIAIHAVLYGYLAYARPGDEAWTPLLTSPDIDKGYTSDRSGRVRAHDVVQWGSQFLFIFKNGVLGYCDVSAFQDCSQPPMVMEYKLHPLEIMNELYEYGMYKMYLLESFGDLLMVIRLKDLPGEQNDPDEWDRTIGYETVDFEVYKLNFGTKIWEEVNDLGDVALFVGNNSSMSLCASDIDNCRRNCIYFTDDEWQFWHVPKDFGGHDIGVFNMGNSEFEKVYEGDDVRSNFCAPTWFMPKLF